MVVPCPSVQPIKEALEDCTRSVIPIILYAVNQPSLSPEQVAELRKVKEILSFPICYVRLPDTSAASGEPGQRYEKDKSKLQKQLLSHGLLSGPTGNCSCGAPTQMPTPGAKPQSVVGENFEKLHRTLVPFTRQVLQNQQVEAASLLNGLHCRCLDLFINQVRPAGCLQLSFLSFVLFHVSALFMSPCKCATLSFSRAGWISSSAVFRVSTVYSVDCGHTASPVPPPFLSPQHYFSKTDVESSTSETYSPNLWRSCESLSCEELCLQLF